MIGQREITAAIGNRIKRFGGDAAASFDELGVDRTAVMHEGYNLAALYARERISYREAVQAAYSAGFETALVVKRAGGAESL